MLESRDRFAAIYRHGEVDLAFFVVKIKVDSTVFLSLPIFVNHIMFFENFDKVISVLFSHIFHSKIVDYRPFFE